MIDGGTYKTIETLGHTFVRVSKQILHQSKTPCKSDEQTLGSRSALLQRTLRHEVEKNWDVNVATNIELTSWAKTQPAAEIPS